MSSSINQHKPDQNNISTENSSVVSSFSYFNGPIPVSLPNSNTQINSDYNICSTPNSSSVPSFNYNSGLIPNSFPSSSNKRRTDQSNNFTHDSLNKKARQSSSDQDSEIICFIPEKKIPDLIVIDDSTDSKYSHALNQPIGLCNSNSIQMRRYPSRSNLVPAPVNRTVNQSTEPKVSIEEVLLMRRKRPKITYFKLISDAFHDSRNTWLNCEQIRKRISQKYAYYRELDDKRWKNSVYSNLARKNLFDRKNVISQKLKLYSLRENVVFADTNCTSYPTKAEP